MKTNEAASHNQLLRLRKILALLRDNKRITQAQMAKSNECSTKSIQRDVNVLLANGWPIEFDREGYYFAPNLKGDLKSSKNSQVAALVLAGCSIDKYLIEYLPAVAMAIRGSILDLPDLQSIQFHLSSSQISVERCSMNKSQLTSFGAIARNIIEELAVVFKYQAVSHTNAILRIVYPISIKQKDGVWYLIGYDLERSVLRVFTASKIKNVLTYTEPYENPSSSIIEQALNFGEFSIWDSGSKNKSFIVKVKLYEHAADFVRTHTIHPSQKVEVIDSRSVLLKLKTTDLTGVIPLSKTNRTNLIFYDTFYSWEENAVV